MNISFCCTDTKAEPWLQGLRAALPGAHIEVWQPGAPAADYAVVWAPPQAFLDEQPRLKALFNIGAGVDALLKLRLPPHTRVVRLDDGSREHLHQAEWAINPALMDQFSKQRTEIIVARQRAEDERRRIAKIERRIVKGFDPETMEPMLRVG